MYGYNSTSSFETWTNWNRNFRSARLWVFEGKEWSSCDYHWFELFGKFGNSCDLSCKNANVSNIEAAVKEKDLNDEHVAMEVQSPLVDHTNAAKTVKLIRTISERFVNTAYGFFLGERVAYPVVANYVRNTWGKFGLVKSMLNSSTGLFSFQFSSTDGLN
nr:zinc knuckle CX2CX4HX4C [Tanacetum cinerariifolium]